MMQRSVFFAHFLTAVLGVFTVNAHAKNSTVTKTLNSVNPAPSVQLHLPWALFEDRILSALTGNGGTWRQSLPDLNLPMQGLDWKLSGLRIDAQLQMGRPSFTGSQLHTKIDRLSLRLGIDQISVDQTIVRVVSGVEVRVRVQAQCGPLRLIQENAQVDSLIGVQWKASDITTELLNLQLAWAPQSWSLSEFHCTGPGGLAELMQREIPAALNDPEMLRNYMMEFLSTRLQSELSEALKNLKTPLELPSEQGGLVLQAGALHSAPSGLVIPFSVFNGGQKPSDESKPSAVSEKDDARWAKLPKDRPTLLAPIASLESLLQNELATRPELISVKLNEVSAFQRLLSSRFLQFFVWPDLWNYSKTSPFYLRIQRPATLRLDVDPKNGLKTNLDLRGVIQSKRKDQWWDYIQMQGSAKAKVGLKMEKGLMSFTTSLENPELQTNFASVYKKRFGSTGWLASSLLKDSLKGAQPALSMQMQWPDVDLGVAGKFQAEKLQWLDNETLVMPWVLIPGSK